MLPVISCRILSLRPQRSGNFLSSHHDAACQVPLSAACVILAIRVTSASASARSIDSRNSLYSFLALGSSAISSQR